MPATPGRLSTSTAWPRRLPRRSPTRRATMSEVPPGGKVTISRSGLDGHWAAVDCAIARTASAKSAAMQLLMLSSMGVPQANVRCGDAPAFRTAHPGLHLPAALAGGTAAERRSDVRDHIGQVDVHSILLLEADGADHLAPLGLLGLEELRVILRRSGRSDAA